MKRLLPLSLLIVLYACSPAHDQNISVAEAYVEAVETLDYEAMESLLADDYLGFGPSAGDSIGKTEAMENWKLNTENLYESIRYNRSQFAGVTIPSGPNKGDWVANWAELEIT
jgi:hypothetical protein